MQFDWILFDADHTIFDFDRSSEEALTDTLDKHGVVPQDHHWGVYWSINKECWAAFERGEMERETMRELRFSRFFDSIGAPHLNAESFGSDYLQLLPQKPYFLDGAVELLDSLHGRVKLGIITNGLREVQRPRLESTGIDRLFEVIVVSGEIDQVKPNHGFFDYTHGQMGRPDKRRVLVVGDSLTADIAGGLAFGFKTCWFNPSGHQGLTDITPHYEVGRLHEVLSILGFNAKFSDDHATPDK